MDRGLRVLISGGGGFIAPHLVASLPSDWDVSVHIRNSHRTIRYHPSIRLFYGSMNEADLIAEMQRGIDLVVHLAGTVHGSSTEEIIDSNLVTTRDVLTAMERCGVPKLVFVSTASVWSDNQGCKLNEAVAANPSTLYGYAKLSAERLINASVAQGAIESAVILRCNSTYGPRCVQGAVFSFIQQIRNSAPITIYGDGRQLREPLYVGDLVNAIYRSISLPCGLHLFGMSGPESLTIFEMAETISQVMGCKLQVQWRDEHPERVRHITIDTSKAQVELGWAASVFFREGIAETIRTLASWDNMSL